MEENNKENEEDNYQKFVNLLNSMQKKKSDQIQVLNLSEMIDSENTIYADYKESIAKLESFEKRRFRAQPKEALQAVQPGQAVSPHIITSGLQQAQYVQQVKTTPQAQAPANVSKEMGGILNKFASFTKEMNKNKQEKKIMKIKINIKDLVLPNLPVSDQISELERIIEGLNEHVFDSEHLEIVAEEVYGLEQYINIMKKAEKGKKKQLSDLERSLEELRDQRLSDAVALLSKYNSSSGS
ncbi:MAG: hypothetical protein ACP5RI_02765 [Candidatus Micrarchaeia archaeon]